MQHYVNENCFLIAGDWIIMAIHFFRQFGYLERPNGTASSNSSAQMPPAFSDGSSSLIDWSKFQHFPYFTLTTAIGSYAIYFAIGGFLHVS